MFLGLEMEKNPWTCEFVWWLSNIIR